VNPQFIPPSLNVKVNKGSDQKKFHDQAIALRRYVAASTQRLPSVVAEPVLRIGRRAFKHLVLERLPVENPYAPLDADLRQELLQDFMPDIRQLEDLLGRDLAIWYGPPQAKGLEKR
jgi:hypothetical protein